ncbi:Lrp/AsnC family transcriptional regulator [Tomitella fengzijianii]|uniref:Lrp/AsnC family transcriptional regulator n=1 Tax=Tomitella fengzijianii TaxID=2597660 RepID=A0A516X6F5_9ACTN|nr:Lrp/AsnC family transcriptional regulator [Tomitella fengzijianii]QDQ98593.1 Lrp/AsnC family transcriptional regulator [Tomitella fengzijianii]
MGDERMHVSADLDTVDKQIVRALQLRPRAPFSLIGSALGLSEQTAARRFRRLNRAGLMRVTAGFHARALGFTTWIVRVRCRPEGAQAVAEALARRDDVSWVTIISGGWEVTFNLSAHSDRDAEDLLVRLLPKTTPVIDVSAAAILHSFAGEDPADWQGWRDMLTADQVRHVRAAPVPAAGQATRRPRHAWSPDDGDAAILDALVLDGRAEYSALARAAGTTLGKARRRVDALLASGVIYLDVDIAPAATGNAAPVVVWLTVAPGRLDAVGHAIAAHPAVPFAAALTGPANIMATLSTATLDDAYRFVTDSLGPLDGITGYEVTPMLRHVKQAGAYVVDGRLSVSPAGPARPAKAPARRGNR